MLRAKPNPRAVWVTGDIPELRHRTQTAYLTFTAAKQPWPLDRVFVTVGLYALSNSGAERFGPSTTGGASLAQNGERWCFCPRTLEEETPRSLKNSFLHPGGLARHASVSEKGASGTQRPQSRSSPPRTAELAGTSHGPLIALHSCSRALEFPRPDQAPKMSTKC